MSNLSSKEDTADCGSKSNQDDDLFYTIDSTYRAKTECWTSLLY